MRHGMVMGARKSSSGRRPNGGGGRNAGRKRSTVRLDPILDDGDVDTTDVTTFVSCTTCFNSIMLRPEQLGNGPMRVKCNCCERVFNATLERLENISGRPFDADAWRAQSASDLQVETVEVGETD